MQFYHQRIKTQGKLQAIAKSGSKNEEENTEIGPCFEEGKD